MRFGADQVVVRVPATSGNLGPGFDSLGLALAIYDETTVRLTVSGHTQVTVRGQGAGEVPDGDTHLVARAIRHTFEAVGAPQTGMELTCTNRIPHGQGLGSSAAATVAGIVAARARLADPQVLDLDEVLALATQFEGHPDNAAPAITGGATLAWTDSDGPHALALEVADCIEATVAIPSTRLATKTARAVLPAEVPHADAAFNAGRAGLLVAALAYRPDLLFPATADRLHQDYRASHMVASAELLRALRAAGFAATISGAGPAVLVLSTPAERVALAELLDELLGGAPSWRVLRPGIDALGAQARRGIASD